MQPCTMWYVDESQHAAHLPSILSRLAALATSSRLLRDFSSGSAIFLLNPDPLALSFHCWPFLLRSSFYSSQKRNPPPRLSSLTRSTCSDFSYFFTCTCTCMNKAVVSRTEIYLTLILSLPRSPPLPLCLQDTAGRSPTFVMLHERTPTSSEGCVNSVEGK